MSLSREASRNTNLGIILPIVGAILGGYFAFRGAQKAEAASNEKDRIGEEKDKNSLTRENASAQRIIQLEDEATNLRAKLEKFEPRKISGAQRDAFLSASKSRAKGPIAVRNLFADDEARGFCVQIRKLLDAAGYPNPLEQPFEEYAGLGFRFRSPKSVAFILIPHNVDSVHVAGLIQVLEIAGLPVECAMDDGDYTGGFPTIFIQQKRP